MAHYMDPMRHYDASTIIQPSQRSEDDYDLHTNLATSSISPWSASDALSLITIISAPIVTLPMLGASGILQAMPSPIATKAVISAGTLYGWPLLCLAGGACVVVWVGVSYVSRRIRWPAKARASDIPPSATPSKNGTIPQPR
ncbi:hypothetical protein PLEOSDRAFT_173905 [Pleurotus ostreatus PC15]|uniref:Uncharacterized protein n=1 Tax=Pleurotus ostreatus (strain PC15) TaxID=1137138 RepID=A0A067NHI1_PLEO1|nr:hypothetical protein PLEOSDRAFT_173905 [Pleurotus ostreatus PC15]